MKGLKKDITDEQLLPCYYQPPDKTRYFKLSCKSKCTRSFQKLVLKLFVPLIKARFLKPAVINLSTDQCQPASLIYLYLVISLFNLTDELVVELN
jgi:hypothetical protein